MLGIFNSITLGATEIYRGNDFTLQREYVYAGEIETCTGDRYADLVGWRYSDLTIEWDMLPEDQMDAILNLSGAVVSLTFSNESNDSVTEQVIPRVITSTATRFTRGDGTALWKGVSLQLQFMNAHN